MANAFQRDAFQDDAFQEAPGQDFVLRGNSQRYKTGRVLPSRIVVVNTAAVVTTQAVGRIRVRATADGTAFAPTVAQATVVRSKIKDVLKRRSASSRVVDGQEPVAAVVTAQAIGRARLRSTADGDPFESGEVLWTSGQGTINTPIPARLRSRVVVVPKPIAPIVTAQAVGSVKLRSTADGISFLPAVASLRPTKRSRQEPDRKPASSRIITAETSDVTVISASAIGRVRVRGTADGIAFTDQAIIVLVGHAQTPEPSRLRSRRLQIPVATIVTVVTASSVGRVRLRATATATVSTPATITASAAGRIRIRSTSTATSGVDWDVGVIIAATGTVYVAPTGTPAPTQVRSTLDIAFLEMGFLSEEGISVTQGRSVEPKSSWTSLYPKEFITVEQRILVGFALREFNKRAVEFALEGAITPSGAEFKYTPSAQDRLQRALVVDWEDGTHLFRLYLPFGTAYADIESRMTKTTSADLPIVFGAVKNGSADPYTMFMSN